MADPRMAVLEGFFAALRESDFEALKAQLSTSMLRELAENIPNDEAKAAFLAQQRRMVPERIELIEEAADGQPGAMAIYVRAIRSTPEGEESERIIAEFAEEDGAIRLAGIFPAAAPVDTPPEVTKRATDDLRGDIEDYRAEAHVNVGGPVVRVAFGEEYSMLVLRVLDEEQTVFLPTRGEIGAAGIDPELLVPGAIAEVNGHPHRTDDCKVLGTNLTVRRD